jgi:hypothetical protein
MLPVKLLVCAVHTLTMPQTPSLGDTVPGFLDPKVPGLADLRAQAF